MTGAIESQQYIKDVSQEMQKRVSKIKKDLNPIYFNLLMNKLASALPTNFLLNVYKVKKSISVDSSQQFLYDIQNELRNLLFLLPRICIDPSSGQIAQDPSYHQADSYKVFVDKQINKIVVRCKVLGYPPDAQVISDGYQQIIDQHDKDDKNKSTEDLVAILTLRGVAPKSSGELKQSLGKFENWLNSLS